MKAKQFFAVGKNDISYLGNDFVKWFGEMPLAEGVAGEFHKLGENITGDEEIIKKFKPECSLGDIAAQWSKLDRKEWYLFYVRDNSGLLRTVRVRWHDDGWGAGAFALGGRRWGDGQVFSLNMKICPISSNLPKEKEPDALDRIASALERIARECEKHQLNRASEASRKELTKLKCP